MIIDATTGRILVANKAAAAIFNFPSPEEMVGINPLDHIPDEDRGFIAVLQAQGLEMDHPAPAEIRVRVKDGRLIWVSVTSSITEHENKRATLLSLREITPEKAKETAMRGAERLYQHLFDTMLDGAVVLDAASALVVLANQAAARIFGFASPLEMVGRNPLEHVPPEDQQRVAQLMSDSFTSNLGNPVQLRLVTKDKRVVWISARGNLIELEGKKVTLTIIRDITSEKVQDAALREAEHQYEGLFDGMLDGALVLDVSTFEIVLANKAVAEMFGFESPREVIGENPLSYIPEEDRDNVARMIALNLEGKGQNPAEIRVVTKDRRNLWISATATRVDYEGRTATLTTLRDITADKAKDAALRAAEESRLQLMDASSEGITIVQDGKLVYVNSAIAQGAGIPREQLMGLAFLDLIHPDERQAVWQRYERIMAGEWFSEIATMRGLNVKGETLWAEVREIPFTWQGRPAVMSLIHDITARMRLEEERKEREERFRAIIENAWDGITILDENYSVIYESPSLARITGYTPEEWMGRPVGQMNIHPDDLAPLLAKIETLKSQPGSVITDVKIRYQRKDGSWRWIEATGRNLLHDPKVKGLVVNFRDITENVRADEERKASEERFRTLIEKATDVVIVLDATGKITYQSPSLERVTGFGSDEWVGRPLDQLMIHPDDLASLSSLLQRVLTQPGATFEGITARYQHKDGSWHTLEATVTNMLHDAKVNGLVANFRDITDRKTAEEALKRSEALLRDTQELARVGGWEYDVERNEALWTDETYRIHEIPKIPTIDHVAESLKCYPPQDRQTIARAFQKCLEEGVPYDLELPFVTFKGKHRWVRTSAKAVHEGDRIVRVLGNIADITERKRMEDALRSSEERNRLLIDSAAEVVTVVQEGSITFINRKCFDLCGYTPEELVSRQFLELIHPEDRQMLADNYVRRLSGEDVPAVYGFRVLHQNGSIRWAAASVTLFTWNGSPATLGLLTDISSRKQAEEGLRAAKEYAENIIRTANVLFVALDRDGNVTQLNEAGEKITGYQQGEVLGKNWFELIVPRERYPKVWEAFEKVKGEGAIAETFENPILTKSGEERIISWKNRTLVLNDEVVGTLSFGMDLTERKKTEEALKESEAKYKHLFESTQTAMEVISMETGLVVLANEATARMFGFASPDDLVGEDSMKYLRPEDVGWVSEKMAQAVTDSAWREIQELQVRTRDGRWIWISGMVIQSEYQGKPALLVSLLDITSRKQAEQTLRKSEEKYRLLTEKTNDVIYTTDLDFNDTYVSPSVEKILGFAPEEHLARSPDQQMTLESLARAQEALLGHLALEKDPQADPNRTSRIELEYYHKDGSTVWLEHQVSGLRDANRNVVGLHGVARDISERRRAEQAVRESEEKYRLLAEKTNDIIWTADLNMRSTYVSPSVERILGFTPEERLRQDAAEQLTPESFDQAVAALAHHLAMEQDPTADPSRALRIELEYCRKDGSTVWLENQVSGIRDADGTLVGFHGVARDVTERRKAEQLIRESEEKYRLLTEKTSDLIYTTDLNFRNMYVSPSVERVLGFTPEEHMERDAAQQMTPESLARAAEALREQLALEQDPKADPNRTVRIELECYRKDGSTVWLEQHVNFMRDDSGTVVGLHGGARDITERRRAEQALKESEAKYRLVAESTNDEIWTSDMNLNTTYVSPSVEKLLGFTVEERMKQDVMAQMTPDSFAKATDALAYHLALEEDPEADPNRVLRIELEYYRKDGSTIWLENQVSGIRDVSGKLVGLHGVARDVTERRQMVQALRERLKELQCLAGVSRLAEKPELPIEEFVREAVGLLPPAWQYPEICGACVQFDSKEFKTANYGETEWRQSADITVDEKRFGTVTVCYLEKMPEADEGPFLKEERVLINTVADFLGHVIQHRQTEGHLRASEERYRLLADNASDIIWVIDASLRITYVSPSASSLIGYSLEEIMADSFDKILTAESLTRAGQVFMDDMAGENVTPGSIGERIVEIEAVCRDGSTVWLEAVTKPIRDAGGWLTGFQGACRDITKRRRTQEALAASETNYRNLFEHTLLGMEVVDLQTGKTVLANSSLARMFGFKSPADMVGTNPLDYVLPEDLEWVANEIAQLMADPSWDKKTIIRSRTEDGRLIWCTGMATPFEYEGRPRMLISLVDITAAKESEIKLVESEEKNRLLIEVAAEGIAVIQDGVTRFFNRRLEELTGWSSEELLSKSFLDLVHPDDREMVALNYMKRIAGEEVPNNYQFRIIDEEGTTKWVQVSAVRLAWEGKPATLNMFSEVTERVIAEQALRDSEERFRALIEKATDAVAVVDAAGNIRYYTPSMERVTGHRPGEWVDKGLSDLLIHPDDLPKLVSVLDEVLKAPGASVENFTTRYQHQDGTWHVLEATARNMLHDPKIGGIVANFRDVTERVRAEQSVRKSEERFRALVQNLQDVIFIMDIDGKVVFENPATAVTLGESLLGKIAYDVVHTEDVLNAKRAFNDVVNRVNDDSPLNLRMRRTDGSWLNMEVLGANLFDDISVRGMLVACRNITDRKKAEDSLRQSEERFRGLVETTSDWVWEIDRNSRYTYVSPRVRDILGYEPQEMLEHTPFAFMHQREGRRVSKIVRRFAAQQLPFSLLENTCTHKDGHSVVMETSAVPIIDSDGTFHGYRGIDRDITERKKVEQELQHSLKRLEKTMESTIEAITTTIETRDPYTTGHQMRVTDLACAIAKVMEIPPTQIEGIRVAGLLHDIGKISIPTEILSKPGKLNEVEYEMIKTHAKVGYNILKKIEFPWPVARTVLQHHERWNGSGYPHGIRGEDILVEARILAVADVMEAMSSHRPYRPSIGAEKALDEISQNSGILYDPAVADACITAFTRAGFKFASSLPGIIGEPESTSASHPVHYLEDH